MIGVLSKGLNHKPAMIKAVPPGARRASPSKAFALWLALLVLYFLILPSAAETPADEAGLILDAGASPVSSVPHRVDATPLGA